MNGFLAQFISSVISNFPSLMQGMLEAWSSPIFTKLTDPSMGFNIKPQEVARAVEFSGLGGIVGAIFSWYVVDKVGRKLPLAFSLIPMIACYAIIAFLPSFPWLSLANALGGFSNGITVFLTPMYVGEIAQNRYRGGLALIHLIFINVGSVFSYIVGSLCSYQVFAFASGIPAIFFLISFLCIPETPYFLLMKGKQEEARKSLTWLRGSSEIEDELSKMKDYVHERSLERKSFMDLFTVRRNLTALLICLSMNILPQLAGGVSVVVYTDVVFERVGVQMTKFLRLTVVGLAALIGTIVGAFVIDLFKRKPIMNLTIAGCCLCHVLTGTFVHLQQHGYDLSKLTWLPILTLIGFKLFVEIGPFTVPVVFASEIFPTNVKAAALMLYSAWFFLCGSAAIELFQVIFEYVGLHATFYVLGVSTVILYCILYPFVPETKGKSFIEIEQIIDDTSKMFSRKQETRF